MSAEDVTPVAAAPASEQAVTQIEFYLSDSNLPFDKFLFSTWSNSFHSPAAVVLSTAVPESDAASTTKQSIHHPFHLGWVPLSVLTSFKRMAPLLAPAPEGLGSIDAVALALERSTVVEAKKFGESEEGAGWYVRRKLQLSRPDDAMERSVYIKGFPVEELAEDASEADKAAVKEKELALQIEMENWIKSLSVGQLKSLRMRREVKPSPANAGKGSLAAKRGKFKGSLFVEFASKEAVAAYLALDPAPTFRGQALESMTKAAYVEMKRQIYAPDSKPAAGAPVVPKTPYGAKGKQARPFNAWAEQLVGPEGFPQAVQQDKRREDGKKRKADEDGPSEREVLFDGVRFTARKNKAGEVEIVDEDKVGTAPGEWTSKVLRFTIGPKSGEKETGELVNFRAFKDKCAPIAKPGFFSLTGESRPIAPLPETKMETKSESAFPAKLTAPPTIGSASAPAPAASAAASDDRSQEYPAKGQASFRDTVSDELFAKLQKDVATFDGRPVEWVRVSAEDERSYTLGRARFHATQAFEPQTSFGGRGGRGGGRGGAGGRGGRGRGGARGGRGDNNKRQRRD